MYYLVIFVMRENYYINTKCNIVHEHSIREVGENRFRLQIYSATIIYLYKLKLIILIYHGNIGMHVYVYKKYVRNRYLLY